MNCTVCGVEKTTKHTRQWWSLNNYHGISGDVCTKCWFKIKHNAQGKPLNKEKFDEAFNQYIRTNNIVPEEPQPARRVSSMLKSWPKKIPPVPSPKKTSPLIRRWK